MIQSTLGLRSRVTADGVLELSLESEPVPPPASDEVLVEMHAAPLHPADIGLLLGPADLSTGQTVGQGADTKTTFKIPPQRHGAVQSRRDKSLPVGNEGAGVVVAAGDRCQSLVGRQVSLMGGAMVTRHRLIKGADCLILPPDVSAIDGAAALVNPLTALAMLETMRGEGHRALVHTAAASSLGQMLLRICLHDDVPLVNIVRAPQQADLLREQGARHVCDSSTRHFTEDLAAQIAATQATLAFDAIGGGPLASQILSAMEHAALAGVRDYSRYGSAVRKQVYFYGGLDTSATTLDRSYGMSWGAGGWLIFDQIKKMGSARLASLRARIASELKTTFATRFAGVLSMTEALRTDNIRAFAQRKTGDKWLIDPHRHLD